MDFKGKNYWALILGGSSGFGLATAKKLSKHGMNICIVHRDRKGAMERIEEQFSEIRSAGVSFAAFNLDALSAEGRAQVLTELSGKLNGGKIRLLMHSIAFGNLKLIAPQVKGGKPDASALLAEKLGVSADKVKEAANALFQSGHDDFYTIAEPPAYNNDLFLEEEDMANTTYAMGTSMLSWVRDIFQRQMFASDARVIGMTSEGNEVAWRGYAAVSVAKVALESVSRSIAVEFAPYGIRSNIVQAGVTDTPALRLIPGSAHLSAHARKRNPMGRLTQPEDVANFIALLCTDEAAWVNGEVIRVDGGERIAG